MSYYRNADAFGKLVGVCAGYGGKYNPTQTNLQVNSLWPPEDSGGLSSNTKFQRTLT